MFMHRAVATYRSSAVPNRIAQIWAESALLNCSPTRSATSFGIHVIVFHGLTTGIWRSLLAIGKSSSVVSSIGDVASLCSPCFRTKSASARSAIAGSGEMLSRAPTVFTGVSCSGWPRSACAGTVGGALPHSSAHKSRPPLVFRSAQAGQIFAPHALHFQILPPRRTAWHLTHAEPLRLAVPDASAWSQSQSLSLYLLSLAAGGTPVGPLDPASCPPAGAGTGTVGGCMAAGRACFFLSRRLFLAVLTSMAVC